MKVFYNDNYTASEYAFDTTRKSGEIATSLVEFPIAGVSLADPTEYSHIASRSIKAIHSAEYINDVKTGGELASSQGFDWDEGIYTMARFHAAGLIAAVDEVSRAKSNVFAGSLSSGLHHANHNEGSGFCTFNGLAAAAHYAITEHNYSNICIVDFDAHAGGGTYDIISRSMPDRVSQLDLVVSPFDLYKVRLDDDKSVLVNAHNSSDDQYITHVRMMLARLADIRPDLVIYNAGMDPYNAGITRATLSWREEIVATCIKLLNVPAIFALAGGYTWGSVTMQELSNLHRLTIRAFAEAQG